MCFLNDDSIDKKIDNKYITETIRLIDTLKEYNQDKTCLSSDNKLLAEYIDSSKRKKEEIKNYF